MNWKKSAICCVSFVVIFFGEVAVNLACGPEQDPFDYYISYFHNNTQGKDYVPFSFNRMVYLYDREEVESEAEVNSAEWAVYLQIKKQDVLQVMYKADSVTEQRSSQSPFLNALRKNQQAKDYFLFAKECEPFAKSYYDSWDPVARDSSIVARKATDALRLAKTEKDSFLKLRYAYQAARLYFYAGNFVDCKTVYEKMIAPVNASTAVKGWSLSLYAGAVRFTGNPARSAYLFSKVFASNPERRVQAYRNFFYTNVSADSVFTFAENNEEKANILAISSFNNPEPDLKTLQQVYHYAPKSRLNGALLVRAVNKLELNLIQSKGISEAYYAGYFERAARFQSKRADTLKAVHLTRLSAIRNFALRLATDKQYPEPTLGMLTAAYLSWMEHRDELALSYLAKLKVNQLPALLRDQYRIIELLVKGNRIKRGSAFDENELLPALKWLDEKRFAENKLPPDDQDYYDVNWGNGNARFTLTTRNFYREVLAPAYLKMGDTAKAALALLKGDAKYKSSKIGRFEKHMSDQTLFFWQNNLGSKSMNRLVTLKAPANDKGLEGWLSKGLAQLDKDDFNELFGTVYLRRHQYAKALNCFNSLSAKVGHSSIADIGSDADGRYYANPFIARTRDYPKAYGTQAPGIDKKSFAREMLRLQKLLKTDPKHAARYYYRMANAIYQTGYYGNSWFLISYDWNSMKLYNPIKFIHDGDYKVAKTAKSWYLKARSLSKDPDFRAKCTFMLAKCQQKVMINEHYGKIEWYDGDYQNRLNSFLTLNRQNPYFKELKTAYARTPFYQTAVSDCSYLADFLKMN